MSARVVLIADADPAMRRLLKAILKSSNFEVVEVEDGIDAIAVANRSNPSIIMLDINLPGLDGLAVCMRLKKDPNTSSIPIMMMGDRPSREMVVSAVKAGASDFLVKTGVSVETLRERVMKLVSSKSAEQMGRPTDTASSVKKADAPLEKLDYKTVEKKLDNLIAAKALPFLAAEVLAITLDSGSNAKDLVEVIERDQGIAARLLKLTNSSYFSRDTKIRTVTNAVGKLGFKGVREIVFGMSLVESMGKNEVGRFDRYAFWRHSLAVGALTDLIAGGAALKEIDFCMTAGILHDIGKAIVDDCFPDNYGEIVTAAKSLQDSLRVYENYVLGMDHTKIGGRIAENWRLPNTISGTILYHHMTWEEIGRLPVKFMPRLVGAVKLADLIVRALDLGFSGECLIETIPAMVFKQLELTQEMFDKYVEALKGRLKGLEQVYLLHEGMPEYTVQSPDADGAAMLFIAHGNEINPVELLLRSWNYKVTRVVSLPQDVAQTKPAAVVFSGTSAGLKTAAMRSLLTDSPDTKVIVITENKETGIESNDRIVRFQMPLHRERILEALGLNPAPVTTK